jgi:hypothetical protein
MRIKRQSSRRDFLWNGLIYIPTGILAARSLQAAQQFLPNRRKAFQPVGGGGAALSFVTSAASAWNATGTSKTTGSFSVQSGDVIVCFGVGEDNGQTGNYNTPTNSGTAFTWTNKFTTNGASAAKIGVWTTTATATQSMTVTLTCATGALDNGVGVMVFRNSAGGFGATANTTSGGSAPSLAITTLAANSMLVTVVGDWNAVDGAARTWRTVNSITPTAGNGLEVVYSFVSGHYTVYAAYYSDTGATGSKTVGLSAPTGQSSTVGAVEVKP